ncbi:CPBP family intramembrane glutamic endopeptidase [Qaidamihabitans albus]|uniref:CPBP family intramembrane glutamic endopeptidase n=1 Tax=Qaidamihabitans albus TaxID=2795733 RepID=UPI0018F1E02E|nr:CPBP family intramembrane glutamic endopeptidase [Qaidamihabitans albus]
MCTAIVGGIVEEVVFRQKLMDLLPSWGTHVVWQVLLSAVVFGVAHAAWVLLRGELAIVLPVVVSTAVLGALLAITYVVGDRNVLPAIVAHVGINLVIEPWLILAGVSGQWKDRTT